MINDVEPSIWGIIVGVIIAIFATNYSIQTGLKKEKESILEALLIEINFNLVHADNILKMLATNSKIYRFPALKNSVWNMGTSKGLNPKELENTDSAYYKLELINELIRARELYNLFVLANFISNENLLNIEETIKQEINKEKDGILVLFQNAKKEVESIKEN